jgi:hypothetical protein
MAPSREQLPWGTTSFFVIPSMGAGPGEIKIFDGVTEKKFLFFPKSATLTSKLQITLRERHQTDPVNPRHGENPFSDKTATNALSILRSVSLHDHPF